MFFAFLLFSRFLHGQKIIIFKVVYQKACDIPWKRNTIVYICLFSYFDLTFYISQEQWTLQKTETLQLGSTTKLKLLLLLFHCGTAKY